MSQQTPAIFFLMGPTAIGKTALAVELAQKLPCELISVDSAMIYRQMNIGTGKPDPSLLIEVKHHLIDICDPAESYSAASFCQDALRSIQEIFGKGKIPLLVGGTMLYFHSLQFGISALPKTNQKVREQLLNRAKTEGLTNLHNYLNSFDPGSAKRIHVNDPQRLLRAIEVYESSGASLSQHITNNPKAELPFQVVPLALVPEERRQLHQNIATRFDLMLKSGLVDEVKALQNRGDLNENLPSMRAVGYRQIWQYLDGSINFEEMRNRAIIATRQLAKRQLTWMRSWPKLENFTNEAELIKKMNQAI